MAVWKRKAIAIFPELKKSLTAAEYSPYELFFDLVPLVQAAHRENDTDLPKRAYGFAEWCLSQEAKELWNAAGVAFYEDLVKEPDLWMEIIPWLSQEVVVQVSGLWKLALEPKQFQELLRRIKANRPAKIRENVFSTGEIQSV